MTGLLSYIVAYTGSDLLPVLSIHIFSESIYGDIMTRILAPQQLSAAKQPVSPSHPAAVKSQVRHRDAAL